MKPKSKSAMSLLGKYKGKVSSSEEFIRTKDRETNSRYSDEDLVNRMAHHIGHRVSISGYGLNARPPWENIALECDDCGVVIFDFNVHKTKKGYDPDPS